MEEFLNKNRIKIFWGTIFLIVFLTSIPSLIRIYNIRYLYLSSNIQGDAIAANVALRNEYGIGATDLKLKKIVFAGDKNIFYFDYCYHGSGELSGVGEKTYIIEFLNNEIISILEV
jgi:hypothetical protein